MFGRIKRSGQGNVPDDVDKVEAEFDAALGVVGSGIRQATDAEIAVAQQMYPHTVVLLTVHKQPATHRPPQIIIRPHTHTHTHRMAQRSNPSNTDSNY